MQETFAIIAGILAFIGNIPYLIDTIKGKIQPHPYTWGIWSIVSLVTFFGMLEKGAGWGALPTGIAEGFTIIIFLVSLKYGFKNINRKDTIYLAVALLSLIPWVVTKDPTLSVVTVVCIDAIAFIPTLKKAYKNPHSEETLLYEMNFFRHTLTLMSLSSYNIATTFHSAVMIIANSLMVVLITRRGKNKVI